MAFKIFYAALLLALVLSVVTVAAATNIGAYGAELYDNEEIVHVGRYASDAADDSYMGSLSEVINHDEKMSGKGGRGGKAKGGRDGKGRGRGGMGKGGKGGKAKGGRDGKGRGRNGMGKGGRGGRGKGKKDDESKVGKRKGGRGGKGNGSKRSKRGRGKGRMIMGGR